MAVCSKQPKRLSETVLWCVTCGAVVVALTYLLDAMGEPAGYEASRTDFVIACALGLTCLFFGITCYFAWRSKQSWVFASAAAFVIGCTWLLSPALHALASSFVWASGMLMGAFVVLLAFVLNSGSRCVLEAGRRQTDKPSEGAAAHPSLDAADTPVSFETEEIVQGLQRFSQSAPCAVVVARQSGVIVDVNTEAKWLFGYSRDQLIGQEIEMLLPESVRERHRAHRQAFHRLPLEKQRRTDCRARARRADGTEIPVALSVRTVPTLSGWLAVSTLVDLSPLEEADAKLRDAAKRLRAANARLEALATTDVLTGVLNRRGLEAAISVEVERAKRSGVDLFALLVDCDDFKSVNDDHGYASGDQALVEIARRAGGVLRAIDHLGRVGGDEFLVLLPNCAIAEAEQIAGRLCASIRGSAIQLNHAQAQVSASVGLVPVPVRGVGVLSLERVVALGEITLRSAKRQGKSCVVAGVGAKANGTREDFDQVLQGVLVGETALCVQCQPIVTVASGATVGHEIFVRGPVGALQSPVDLLEAARHHDCLASIDLCCLRACLVQAKGLLGNGRIHVNVLPSTVQRLGAELAQLLETVGSGVRWCVELSEMGSFAGRGLDLADAVRRLRECGATIAIDHVGLAQGSLDLAMQIEPEVVKVDATVCAGIDHDLGRRAVLERVVKLARALGAKTVATGIERQQEVAVLEELGVDCAQGYLWALPVPVDEAAKRTLAMSV